MSNRSYRCGPWCDGFYWLSQGGYALCIAEAFDEGVEAPDGYAARRVKLGGDCVFLKDLQQMVLDLDAGSGDL